MPSVKPKRELLSTSSNSSIESHNYTAIVANAVSELDSICKNLQIHLERIILTEAKTLPPSTQKDVYDRERILCSLRNGTFRPSWKDSVALKQAISAFLSNEEDDYLRLQDVIKHMPIKQVQKHSNIMLQRMIDSELKGLNLHIHPTNDTPSRRSHPLLHAALRKLHYVNQLRKTLQGEGSNEEKLVKFSSVYLDDATQRTFAKYRDLDGQEHKFHHQIAGVLRAVKSVLNIATLGLMAKLVQGKYYVGMWQSSAKAVSDEQVAKIIEQTNISPILNR